MKELLRQLLLSRAYPHATRNIVYRETHISWVFLTGDYAYKVKKPVDFGFLDFSCLEKREFYCQEELRLNRRTAPEIYLEVVSINKQDNKITIGGDGTIIDYAVKMQQFDDSQLLSVLADEHKLEAVTIDRLVAAICQFHDNTQPASADSDWGNPAGIQFRVQENFDQIRPLLNQQNGAGIESLEQGSQSLYQSIQSQLLRRKQYGFIRECHGDLHLGNIVIHKDRVLIFDCIEFNPDLHWIDVMSEVAFLLMDLQERGYYRFSWHFLNAYLQTTGDYEGLSVLQYYLAYRAMVRAKIALLQHQENKSDNALSAKLWQQFQDYLQLAKNFLKRTTPVLIIMHGLSASGKSSIAKHLSEKSGMIWIRSDIETQAPFFLACKNKDPLPPGSRYLFCRSQRAALFQAIKSDPYRPHPRAVHYCRCNVFTKKPAPAISATCR